MQLIISEKSSVGKSIASVLGATQKHDGYIEGNGYIVSWCAGHLLGLAAPEIYNEVYAKWQYADLPIIPDKWKHVALKGKAAQLKILTELMKRADVECVINACDAGREGELIFRLVYNYAKCTKKIMRLWISSMEDAAIREGFGRLKDGADYDNLHAAASCRECADWLVGLNMTRLFSVLYGITLNTGRVQSPTLAMLVKREADISAFVKEPFYIPQINCGGSLRERDELHMNSRSCSFTLTASGDKLKNRQAAEMVRAACDGKNAAVVSVERQKKTAAPPKLYDLTTLQREANRMLGFTAQQTLDYAQSLYEKKICTYPRTDSRYITGDMRDTAGALVTWLQVNMGFCNGVSFTPDVTRLINDAKVTDHHAIIPTDEISKANLDALPSGERDILYLVAARLLCAAAPAHSFEAVTVVLDCGGNSFTAKGKTIITDGWKAIDAEFKATLKSAPDNENNGDDSPLPELSEVQTFDSVTATVKEGETSPPKHFTEDTLLSGMETAGAVDMPEDAERKGLGTPATRAAVIEKLVKTGFVERQKKALIPTDKGKNLIAVLPDALASPKLTAEWEHKLKQIERGELSASAFMDGIAAFTKAIVSENNVPKPEFNNLFAARIGNAPLGACPRCGAPVRESAKGFFCDKKECGFKIWRNGKFWTAKKKPPTATIVTALLQHGRVALKDLYSEKTGKKYDATVILDDTGHGYVNFKMDFS